MSFYLASDVPPTTLVTSLIFSPACCLSPHSLNFEVCQGLSLGTLFLSALMLLKFHFNITFTLTTLNFISPD